MRRTRTHNMSRTTASTFSSVASIGMHMDTPHQQTKSEIRRQSTADPKGRTSPDHRIPGQLWFSSYEHALGVGDIRCKRRAIGSNTFSQPSDFLYWIRRAERQSTNHRRDTLLANMDITKAFDITDVLLAQTAEEQFTGPVSAHLPLREPWSGNLRIHGLLEQPTMNNLKGLCQGEGYPNLFVCTPQAFRFGRIGAGRRPIAGGVS